MAGIGCCSHSAPSLGTSTRGGCVTAHVFGLALRPEMAHVGCGARRPESHNPHLDPAAGRQGTSVGRIRRHIRRVAAGAARPRRADPGGTGGARRRKRARVERHRARPDRLSPSGHRARRPVRGIAGPVATPPGAGDSPARNGRIPSPVTPLLGRARELAFARDLPLGDEKRLLTATGPGGQRIEPGASSAHRSTRPSRYRPEPLITFAFCQATSSYRSPAGARIRFESRTDAGTVPALGNSAGAPARPPNAFAGRPRTRP
jgi:hypothetical protein